MRALGMRLWLERSWPRLEGHSLSTLRGSPAPEVLDDRVQIITVFCGKLLADTVNFIHNGIVPAFSHRSDPAVCKV